MRLKGKVAVVTGGGSGIGKAICERFVAEGAKVAVIDIDPQAAQSVAQSLNSSGHHTLAITADVSHEQQVEQAIQQVVEAFGQIDILVNNAGIVCRGTAEELTPEDWDRCLAVDLKGAWLCSKAALPYMKGRPTSIINISSIHAFQGQPAYTAYAVAKGGLVNLTRNMAVDYGPFGVRVNAICPGLIETPLSRDFLEKVRRSPAAYQKLLELHPLRRVGQPEDVANVALFLASEESSFVTGVAILVDGGRGCAFYGLVEVAHMAEHGTG